MKLLVKETKTAWESLGEIKYGPTNEEKKNKIYKRSIYASANINKGEKFTKENIKIIRPGDGLEPKYFDFILGRASNKRISIGNPIKLDFVD